MVKDLEVKGKAEVEKAFSRLSSDVSDLSDANADIAGKVVRDVRSKTRKRTGTLAESWISSGEATRMVFSNPQKYAPTQEYGSEKRDIAPTHAIERAFEDSKNDITDGYGQAVRNRAKRRNIATRA